MQLEGTNLNMRIKAHNAGAGLLTIIIELLTNY